MGIPVDARQKKEEIYIYIKKKKKRRERLEIFPLDSCERGEREREPFVFEFSHMVVRFKTIVVWTSTFYRWEVEKFQK